MDKIETVKNRILAGGAPVTAEEAEQLAAVAGKSATGVELLCRAADEIRRRFCRETFDTCSIVNARSGRCSEDCKWCAQSAFHRTGIENYAMKPSAEMVDMAKKNAARGIGRFCLVTSGKRVERPEMEEFCRTYKEVGRTTGMKLCASMGLIGREEMRMLKEAGVTRYECNLETAPSFFPSLCTTHTVEQKRETLRMAREMGFELCSGGIIGMGETMSQRIELAVELRKLGVMSVPINILNPIKGTALEDGKPLTDGEILTTVALFRFILPAVFIRFAGGRIRMSVELQRRVLRAGLNASLVGGLLTTAGTDPEEDYRLFREAGYRVTAGEQ